VSTYAVARICQLARRDEAFVERLRAEPEVVLDEFRLTDEERRALLAGDVAWLHDQGVHGMILASLARAGGFGLTMPLYLERVKAARTP
jgi:hypothetical protein